MAGNIASTMADAYCDNLNTMMMTNEMEGDVLGAIRIDYRLADVNAKLQQETCLAQQKQF